MNNGDNEKEEFSFLSHSLSNFLGTQFPESDRRKKINFLT